MGDHLGFVRAYKVYQLIKARQPIIISRIADEIECDRSYLYKLKTFMDLVETYQGYKPRLPSGHKDRSGNIEAYDD